MTNIFRILFAASPIRHSIQVVHAQLRDQVFNMEETHTISRRSPGTKQIRGTKVVKHNSRRKVEIRNHPACNTHTQHTNPKYCDVTNVEKLSMCVSKPELYYTNKIHMFI